MRELSLFGLALTNAFRADRDLDVPVLLQPEAEIGFSGMDAMQWELSNLVDRPGDLISKKALNPVTKAGVINSAGILYDEK